MSVYRLNKTKITRTDGNNKTTRDFDLEVYCRDFRFFRSFTFCPFHSHIFSYFPVRFSFSVDRTLRDRIADLISQRFLVFILSYIHTSSLSVALDVSTAMSNAHLRSQIVRNTHAPQYPVTLFGSVLSLHSQIRRQGQLMTQQVRLLVNTHTPVVIAILVIMGLAGIGVLLVFFVLLFPLLSLSLSLHLTTSFSRQS